MINMAPFKFVLWITCLFDLMERHVVIGRGAATRGGGGGGTHTHLAPVEPIDWTSPLTLGLVGGLILLIMLTCFICYQRGCLNRSREPTDKPPMRLTPHMLKKSGRPLTPSELAQFQSIVTGGRCQQKDPF